MSGRGRNSHLVVNTKSGLLGDSTLHINDRAASICPVGALLVKHRGFSTPIGARKFDINPLPHHKAAKNE
jgi:[NiFe] hydrogenase diaphorase moiety small subunit